MIRNLRHRISRAYQTLSLRLLDREIRRVRMELKQAESDGDVTEVLDLDSHLQHLKTERRWKQAALDRIPQPT